MKPVRVPEISRVAAAPLGMTRWARPALLLLLLLLVLERAVPPFLLLLVFLLLAGKFAVARNPLGENRHFQ
jgi:hypothetical protein